MMPRVALFAAALLLACHSHHERELFGATCQAYAAVAKVANGPLGRSWGPKLEQIRDQYVEICTRFHGKARCAENMQKIESMSDGAAHVFCEADAGL